MLILLDTIGNRQMFVGQKLMNICLWPRNTMFTPTMWQVSTIGNRAGRVRSGRCRAQQSGAVAAASTRRGRGAMREREVWGRKELPCGTIAFTMFVGPPRQPTNIREP
jgi:hypothetical protein